MDLEECDGKYYETKRFHWADYLVFGCALLVSVGFGVFHGFFAKKKIGTTAQFFLGNKKMNYVTLGLSLSVG
jgi:hypothetical protein